MVEEITMDKNWLPWNFDLKEFNIFDDKVLAIKHKKHFSCLCMFFICYGLYLFLFVNIYKVTQLSHPFNVNPMFLFLLFLLLLTCACVWWYETNVIRIVCVEDLMILFSLEAKIFFFITLLSLILKIHFIIKLQPFTSTSGL